MAAVSSSSPASLVSFAISFEGPQILQKDPYQQVAEIAFRVASLGFFRLGFIDPSLPPGKPQILWIASMSVDTMGWSAYFRVPLTSLKEIQLSAKILCLKEEKGTPIQRCLEVPISLDCDLEKFQSEKIYQVAIRSLGQGDRFTARLIEEDEEGIYLVWQPQENSSIERTTQDLFHVRNRGLKTLSIGQARAIAQGNQLEKEIREKGFDDPDMLIPFFFFGCHKELVLDGPCTQNTPELEGWSEKELQKLLADAESLLDHLLVMQVERPPPGFDLEARERKEGLLHLVHRIRHKLGLSLVPALPKSQELKQIYENA